MVQVTVLAPPRPAPLHWLTLVTGFVEVVVRPVGHSADPVHEIVVTIVAKPVGLFGVAGLYVKLLVIVIVQVIVSPPTEPVLLHWLMLIVPGAASVRARAGAIDQLEAERACIARCQEAPAGRRVRAVRHVDA